MAFRTVNPLQQLMQMQSTVGNSEVNRQRRLQGRQLDMEEAGREAQFFVSAMGDLGNVDPSTPEGLQMAQQRWGQARQALGQISDDVDDIPKQFDPQALQTIQGIASQYGGGGSGEAIHSTYIDDKGQRIGLFRDGRETVLGKANTGLTKVNIGGRELFFDEVNRTLLDPADVEASQPQSRMEIVQEEADASALRKTQEKEAEESVKVGREMFNSARATRQSIPLYDEAIAALDNGANTGAIASIFPTIQSESKRLENIQNQLGLTVIQATTFGALSEKEMRLAMQVSIPTGLPEPELRKWLQEKKQAQIKAADALENAAASLLSGEMTLSELAQSGRTAGQSTPQQQQTQQPVQRMRYNPETGELEPQ